MNISEKSVMGSVAPAEASTQRKANSDLTMDDFLKIMAATISNPSMSGEGSGNQQDYIGQMAMFSQMEQMSMLTDLMSTSILMTQQQQAISLAGKTVTVRGPEDGTIQGVVEKVRFSNGYATLQIDGKEYNLSDIIDVGGSEE